MRRWLVFFGSCMSSIQQHAADILAAVEDGRTLTDALADAQQRLATEHAGSRGALQDIAYGVLRYRSELLWMLRHLVPRALPEPAVERLLLVALYQLVHTRAAAYAVVNETVNAAAHHAGGRFKGLVNGVLRNALRQKETLAEAAHNDPLARWNHPQWWVDRLRVAYPQDWQTVLAAGNTHPPMTLRVNHRHEAAADYAARLAQAGLECTVLDGQALMLARPVPVKELPGFADGLVSVQDWGAQQAAHRLQLADGQRVLDACAAPGGKTGHMLELADIELTALDIDAARLERVRENLNRLGLSALTVAADAARPDSFWDGRPYDRILADVPCSASGVVRRHPDIKWLRRPEDFALLARQQAAMVDALWGLLASGGKMLYATCSIFPEENRRQLDSFLSRHADATCEGDEQLLPGPRHDGFYYALLAKA
ncbi:16S rRNA (cytosine(967)-C(5))-methyltransferase [Gulbenkiania indica]|uniref:16S rRNA (cytosine(967)-C(5))-methyltransferase n=3 Tax=Chromobacteriaceae TaxID=1499392 RepID=A0A0K6GYL6_9NEIS|nr:16S rRNA (cytosine967-C5)-methyltransferase [Gulbenkiania mobilis]CUA83714.1 16S rRNA (cytosine(967)-C(5))-methyltransferase [Gulbenkiania indica]